MIKKTLGASVALWAMALGGAPVWAQDAGDSAVAQDADAARGARVYTYADLAQYAPRTALDMVQRIPGFSLDGGNQGNRGLGQASQNVLINGQRVAGKSNDAFSALSRIAAKKVVRIEIVDGATLDVPGLSGEVANIIYEEGGVSGTWNYAAQFRPNVEDTFFDGRASLSGGTSRSSWSLSAASNSQRQGHWGPEYLRDPNGIILVRRDEVGTYNSDSPTLAGTYKRTAAGGEELNLSAKVGLNTQRNTIRGVISEGDARPFREIYIGGEDEWNSEFGADYSFDALGGRLKVIGLQRNEHSPTYSQFGIVQGNQQRYEQTVDENESILRSELAWKTGKSDWSVSLEGAYNRLDSVSSLTLLPFEGDAETIGLPDNRIEEYRGESIVSLSRPIATDLSLQLNGGAEYSNIRAGGSAARGYFRPKGSAALSWRASKDVTVNGKIERIVDQLNFFDFLAAVDLQDDGDRERNDAIVPPERWRGRIEAVAKLGEYGSVTPYVQAERIENVIEFIPVSPTEEALGNAGSADRWIAGFDGTLLLAPLGVKGARIDLHAHLGDSSFTDPLLLVRRPLNYQEFGHFRANFRHDIPGTDLAYGGQVNAFDMGGGYRRNQYVYSGPKGTMVDAFIEHKDILGMQAELVFVNLFGASDGYDRIVYEDRRDGPVRFTEDRKRDFGTIVVLGLSGKF